MPIPKIKQKRAYPYKHLYLTRNQKNNSLENLRRKKQQTRKHNKKQLTKQFHIHANKQTGLTSRKQNEKFHTLSLGKIIIIIITANRVWQK